MLDWETDSLPVPVPDLRQAAVQRPARSQEAEVQLGFSCYLPVWCVGKSQQWIIFPAINLIILIYVYINIYSIIYIYRFLMVSRIIQEISQPAMFDHPEGNSFLSH